MRDTLAKRFLKRKDIRRYHVHDHRRIDTLRGEYCIDLPSIHYWYLVVSIFSF